MLPSSQRLSVRQFNFVMEKGIVHHSTLFFLRVAKVESIMTPMDKLGTISKTIPVRVSTVAPNKVAKKATERNYLRRKMYEAVKPIYSDIIDGQYIIVFAKVAATTTTFTQLSEEMKNIFVKAGLLR